MDDMARPTEYILSRYSDDQGTRHSERSEEVARLPYGGDA